mgnify:CR=1 FL=1
MGVAAFAASSAAVHRADQISFDRRRTIRYVDRARGVAIGAHAERVGTFDLEKIGKVVEGAGDLRVVDRHEMVTGGGVRRHLAQ